MYIGHYPKTAAALYRMGAHHCLGGRAERYAPDKDVVTEDLHSADITLDTDDPEHISWLYEKASQRAKEFNIPGVTYSMTQGVVKNIIPAIASTTAIVAAACCNEALKIATTCNPFLGNPGTNNYMLYTGDDSVYTYTFEHQKKDDCPVCGNLAKELAVKNSWTLQDFVDHLAERPEAQLKKPLIRTESKTLYYSVPASLEAQTRPNLKRKLDEMLADGEEVGVSDPSLAIDFKFKIRFQV